MPYGLDPIDIEQLHSVFTKHPKIVKAVLYGSRALGKQRKGSDIDLTLLGKTLTTKELIKIETEIDDLLLPYVVDLSLYHHIDNDSLINHIERVGVVFYQRDKWEVKKWSDVLEIRSGKNQKQVIDESGIYPIMGSSGKVMGYASDYLCEENTTIIGRKGTIDKPLFIQEKFWNVDTAFGLVPSSSLDSKYLYYFCLSYNFLKLNKGTTLPSLVKKDLVNILIPVPPLPEQEAIVAILDKAFAAIDQAKANLEQNITNAKELFQSKLNQIFSQKCEGWEEKPLSLCLKLKSGDGLTAKNMISGPYPVYGGNGIAGNHNEFNLKGEHLIVGRVGALCGNARYIDEPIWLTDNAFKVLLNLEFNLEFLTYLLNHKNLRRYARQAAQPVISNSSLKNVILNFPTDYKEQTDIVLYLDSLRSELESVKNSHQTNLDSLEELKKSILQKAFAGELT